MSPQTELDQNAKQCQNIVPNNSLFSSCNFFFSRGHHLQFWMLFSTIWAATCYWEARLQANGTAQFDQESLPFSGWWSVCGKRLQPYMGYRVQNATSFSKHGQHPWVICLCALLHLLGNDLDVKNSLISWGHKRKPKSYTNTKAQDLSVLRPLQMPGMSKHQLFDTKWYNEVGRSLEKRELRLSKGVELSMLTNAIPGVMYFQCHSCEWTTSNSPKTFKESQRSYRR